MKKKYLMLSLLILICITGVMAQSNTIGSGISLQFNGSTGNYVNLGDVYNTVNFPLTVESWVDLQGYPPIYAGIFASDNDPVRYYGFWVYYTSLGKLRVEFGNGQGAGTQYRRGVETIAPIGLNKWTHLAVVCNSITDIHIYFNGVEKSTIPTDGESTSSSIFHSNSDAYIGRLVTPFAEHNFNGYLDEVRLWTIARSQSDIQAYMCRKVNINTSGLIGYWKADESYTSSSVNDYTTPSENGIIVGSVSKSTSGAAIGDISVYSYTNSWAGVSLTLNSPMGDQFTAKNISGNPKGIHVYRINHAPYLDGGLNSTPNYYFGVFCAEENTIAKYVASYQYSTSNSVVTVNNEANVKLKSRVSGAVASWITISSNPDTVLNIIKKNNQTSRGEYILSVTGLFPQSHEEQFRSSDQQEAIRIYPNPAINKIQVQLSNLDNDISSLYITNMNGRCVYYNGNISIDDKLSLDISNLESGIYILNFMTQSQTFTTKFTVQK